MTIPREWYFEIDIATLLNQVGSLVPAYEQAGQRRDIRIVLERLRGNIKDPRWYQKIAYHKAMAFIVAGDRTAC